MPTNCYVLTSGRIAVIVDPGGGYGKIRAYLEESGMTAVAVVLTHGHFDHITDVFKWHKDGVPVYIHENDAACLFDAQLNLAALVGLTLPPVREYITFSDGEILTFGDIALRVIHTPGHTRGSCCFVTDVGPIFTGDTLMCETYGRTDFPGGSDKDIKNSIREKLFTIEGDRSLYPGHGDSSTLNHERRFNSILQLP